MATWQDYGVLPQPDAISPSFFNSHSSARAADVVSQRRRMTKMVTTQQMFDEVVKGMLIGRPDGGLLGYGGRWERWAPAPPACGGSSTGWTLLSSGRSVYAAEAAGGGSGVLMHVLELEDEEPAPLTSYSEATGCLEEGGAAQRSVNAFAPTDVWFKPYLPGSTASGWEEGPAGSAGGSSTAPELPAAVAGLRLWSVADSGFAMAPTRLPDQLLALMPGTPAGAQGSDEADAAAAAAAAAATVFTANMYIRTPSLDPDRGRRWGWNVQYQGTAAPERPSGFMAVVPLQHVHHTSLGLRLLSSTDELKRGGVSTMPPPVWGGLNIDGPPPGGVRLLLSLPGSQLTSVISFKYDADGQLQRSCITKPDKGMADAALQAMDSITAGVLELWQSSGGYSRAPADLVAELSKRRDVVIEAGALTTTAAPNNGVGLSRWLLTYRASDGWLDSACLESWQLPADLQAAAAWPP